MIFNLFKSREASFMEKEILEQPRIIQNILDAYTTRTDVNLDVPADVERVILVASGSSYHCARYTAELFGEIAGIEAQALYSNEFLLKSAIAKSPNVLYVFITQSGETADTNKALEKAKENGMKTLSITNKENSTIWNASDYKISCLAGEEKSIAATKSLMSQFLCSTLLILKIAQSRGIEIYDYLQDLKMLPNYLEQTLKLRPKIKEISAFISKYKNVVMTADGLSYALAKEAGLKMKETSFLNVMTTYLGEFMHGHVAMLNKNHYVVIYILNDELTYTAIKNLNSIKETYNPPLCVIGNRTNQVKSTYNINIECEKPFIKTFCILLIVQLLALETATKLGRDIDNPKGLHKVVK